MTFRKNAIGSAGVGGVELGVGGDVGVGDGVEIGVGSGDGVGDGATIGSGVGDGVAIVGGRSYRCPEDRIGQPCPSCGYKYGTAWLYEPLPSALVEWLSTRGEHGNPCLGGGA